MKQRQKWQLLVDHYLDFFGLAMAILRNDDDAKDAVQEALTRTLVKHHIDDPVAYCSRAVRNESVSILRRRKRVATIANLEQLQLPLPEPTAPDAVQAAEALPDTTRALMELHDIEGMTYEELALLTGSSATQIRRIVNGAHQYIKERILNETI